MSQRSSYYRVTDVQRKPGHPQKLVTLSKTKKPISTTTRAT